jgi:uncharacterized repeat protein (TIGR02543 family)
LLLTNVTYGESVYAKSVTDENADTVTVEDDDSLTVKGTGSFGSMIAAAITEETDEQENNDGCNIFSIEVNDAEALVSFETTQDASLVVAIYAEDGVEMLATGTEVVTADDTDVVVTIDTETMPEYFYLRGFLVDSETFRSLCTAYESPNYTQEMQEFFRKTTEDFEAERVLNLDEDNTNNFAVFDESVKQLSDEELTLVSADEDNNTYVFENADSIVSMEQGEVFTYACEDGSELIVKIDSIKMDGDTVAVTGMDTSMEEVFEYVKIDTTADMSDVTVDESACDEDVQFNGVVGNTTQAKRTRANETSATLSKSLSYTFLENKSSGITGNLLLKIEGSIKVYISPSYQYIEAKIDYSGKISVKISGKDERKLPLGFLTFCPMPGVYIEFTPSFVVKVSSAITMSGTLSGTVGFRAEKDVGITNISKTPHFETELKGEITVFVGLSMEPKIKIVSDNLANASMNVSVGAEVKGTLKKTEQTSSNKRHECNECVNGDITAKAELEFKTELLKLKSFTFKLKKTVSAKIFDWYFSLDYGEFGLTTCPHYLYKVTITVQDTNKKPITDAVVNVPFTLITKDEQGKEKQTEVTSMTTDKDGKVEGYLTGGTYQISASATNYAKSNKQLIVEKNAKSVGIYLWQKSMVSEGNQGESTDGNTEGNTNEDLNDVNQLLMKNAQTISLGYYHSSAITEDGSLYMWGYNGYGALGDGTTEHKLSPVKVLNDVVSVSLGTSHSAAITEDGSLYVWGSNTYGELGDGTTEDKLSPVKVLDHVVSVSLGEWNSAAITEDGSLYMWGYNGYGELGDGTTEHKLSPVKVLNDVVSVSLGYYNCGAITEDGSLYMWGWNHCGQLGDGTTVDKYSPVKVLDDVVSVSLGGWHSGAITEDGSLYMWGSNWSGQLGDGTTKDRLSPVKVMDHVVYVSLGQNHSGGITEDGSLYMWGYNYGGELGDGTKVDKSSPVKVMDHVVSVSLSLYSGAITEDGSLYMWGYNAVWQFGDGTTEDTSRPVKVMDHIKINTSTVSGSTKAASLKAGSYRQQSRLLKSAASQSTGYQTAAFSNLTPDATYTFYVMRDRQAEAPLDSSNLLYIKQATADVEGNLSVSYQPTEIVSDAEVFVVKSNQEDLSAATVSMPDLEYNGAQQYAQPTVTLDGKVLSEWEDYELLGDYSAQEIGDYTLTIQGIGAYTGTIAVSYKVYGEESTLVQTITLNKAEASLNLEEILQLSAEVLPSDAANKELSWTSDNPEVATVDSNGVVTAVAEGTATIKATAQDGSGVSAACVVTIVKPSTGDAGDTGNNPGGGVTGEGNTSGGDVPGDGASGEGNTSGGDVPGDGASGEGGTSGEGVPGDGASGEGGTSGEGVPGDGVSGEGNTSDGGGATGGGTSGGIIFGSVSPGVISLGGDSTSVESMDENTAEITLQEKPVSTVVAEAPESVTVTFSANGGKNLSKKSITLQQNASIGTLPSVERKNYIFKGWYTQKSGGKKVTKSTKLSKSTTLYARWSEVIKPRKVKSLTVKSTKSGKLSISYDKVSGADGYIIAYSTSKKFTSSSTEKVKVASNKKTLSQLKTGETYYIKVRAYKIDSTGKKIYGTYSKVKKMVVK